MNTPEKRIKIKLKGKINLLILFLLTISIGTVTFYLYEKERANLIQTSLENVKTKTLLVGLKINELVIEMIHDVKILSSIPSVQGIMRARAGKNGVDPYDGSTEETLRSRVESIFEGFLNQKPNYFQIRFIGINDGGREIVRVEKIDEKILKIHRSKLQAKENRFYFKETIKLPPQEVYISPITLNREFGEISEPHTATLRIAVPVYNSQGNIFGLVIINYNISPSLKFLIQEDKNLFVINADGDFLAHQDSKYDFGFDLGKRYRIQDSVPDLAPFIENNNKGYYTIEGKTDLIHFRKQYIGSQNSKIFVGLLHRQSILEITKKLNSAFAEIFYPVLALLFISLSLGMFFTRRLTRPLEQMTQVAKEFSKGQPENKIIVKSDDEIGVLGRTLNEMINERNKNEKIIRRLSSAVQQSPATIVITDIEGNIQYANPSFFKLTGYSESECLNKNMSFLSSGKSEKDFIKEFWDTLLEGGTWRGIWCNKKKNGELFWASAVASSIKDKQGNIINFVEVKEDITEQLKLDEALKESNRKLEISNQALKDFVSFASHDLKEPLRKIHLFGERVQEVVQNLEDKPKDYINRMVNASKRMESLLENLLEYSRISSSGIDAHFFPLEEAISDVKDNLEILLMEMGGTIKYEGLPDVFGDKLLIIQLLQNLIGNSLKFCREGVPPEIKISTSLEENFQKITLEDNGIGIEDKYLSKIFKPFERLHSRSQYEGTGIGLAICRMVVEKHNGNIAVKSKLGEGSTFIITLPEK
jgi:PAS domain S-box-containing protein